MRSRVKILDLWWGQRLARVGVLKGAHWQHRRWWSASEMHEMQPVLGASVWDGQGQECGREIA